MSGVTCLLGEDQTGHQVKDVDITPLQGHVRDTLAGEQIQARAAWYVYLALLKVFNWSRLSEDDVLTGASEGPRKHEISYATTILRRRTLAYIYRYTPRGPGSSSDMNVEVGCERGNARMGTVWSARMTVLAKKDVRPPYDGWTARYILSCEGHLSA